MKIKLMEIKFHQMGQTHQKLKGFEDSFVAAINDGRNPFMVGHVKTGFTDLDKFLDQILAIGCVCTEVFHEGKKELGVLELRSEGEVKAIFGKKFCVGRVGEKPFGVFIVGVFDQLGQSVVFF